MIDVFYEQQLAATKLADRNDFLDPAVKAKKKFEQMLDERVAAGLNKGIDVLMDEVEYICATTQLPTDYNPLPTPDGSFDVGPTATAIKVVALVESHTKMLTGSTDKTMLDVFNQEVGLRLFTAICKHLKRQRISIDGSIKLISDTNIYYGYIRSLRNSELLEYFRALRELSQIYLIGKENARDIAEVVADGKRFGGVFRAEEVYEFVERRADWFSVKKEVERAMYGFGCWVM
jgi:recyclin-1